MIILAVAMVFFLALAALTGGLVGSFISRKLNETWAIPRDHWFPWIVSLGVFCALAFIQTYLSIPAENWRTGGFDRLSGLTIAGAVLVGHVLSYLIVRARLRRSESDQQA